MPEAEGKQFDFQDETHIRPDFLETFDFGSREQYIMTETAEFSCVCPFSGLPDLARVRVEYYPEGGKCVELKSLKYYFVSFRNVGNLPRSRDPKNLRRFEGTVGNRTTAGDDEFITPGWIRYDLHRRKSLGM